MHEGSIWVWVKGSPSEKGVCCKGCGELIKCGYAQSVFEKKRELDSAEDPSALYALQTQNQAACSSEKDLRDRDDIILYIWYSLAAHSPPERWRQVHVDTNLDNIVVSFSCFVSALSAVKVLLA